MLRKYFAAAMIAALFVGSAAFAGDEGLLLKWDAAAKQVVVDKVPPTCDWGALGIKAGDRITKIDDQPLTGPEQALTLIRKSGGVKLTLLREGWEKELSVPGVTRDVFAAPETPGHVDSRQDVIEKLKKAGFTDEQIKVLLEIFQVKNEPTVEKPPEKPPVVPEEPPEKQLTKAGLSLEQARALLKTLKMRGPAAPPPNPQALEDAIKAALARGVPRDAIDKIVDIGKKMGWTDDKIIEQLNKLNVGGGEPGPGPAPTPAPAPAPGPEQPKSEFSPALQDAIKECAERNGVPPEGLADFIRKLKSVGATDEQLIEMLRTLKVDKAQPMPQP
jgi:DNA-binding transcriptional MerR regulator